MTELEWLKVEETQNRSFYGGLVSKEDLELCHKALKENPKRYSSFRKKLIEEYQTSLRF